MEVRRNRLGVVARAIEAAKGAIGVGCCKAKRKEALTMEEVGSIVSAAGGELLDMSESLISQ